MSESIFNGKIKVGKELLRNIVGPVPPKFYDIDDNDWLKSYYYKILKERNIKEENIEFLFNNQIPIGIDINSVQLKILIALLKILTKHHYRSNMEKGSTKYRVGINELVRAYGSDKIKGNTRKRVLENLKALSSKEFALMFNRKATDEENEEESLALNNQGAATKDENGKTASLELVKGRAKLFGYEFITIMGRKFIQFNYFCELFSSRIDDYYTLLPDDFIEKITSLKTISGKKNTNLSKHEIYLHLFLLSQISIRRQKIISIRKHPMTNVKNIGSAAIIRTNFAKLSFQLRMLNSLEKGFWGSIRQKIREYLKRAEAIGYIKRFTEDKDNDSLTIELNIDKVFIKNEMAMGQGGE